MLSNIVPWRRAVVDEEVLEIKAAFALHRDRIMGVSTDAHMMLLCVA